MPGGLRPSPAWVEVGCAGRVVEVGAVSGGAGDAVAVWGCRCRASGGTCQAGPEAKGLIRENANMGFGEGGAGGAGARGLSRARVADLRMVTVVGGRSAA